MIDEILPAAGRRLFGRDVAAYDAGRPDYPPRVFEILARCLADAAGTRTLEVGAGSGRVTRSLVEIGADPIVAIEPDRRFSASLERLAAISGGRVELVVQTFEDCELEPESFDLVVCATSYHWLDPQVRSRALGACLRPGGFLVLFWNVFGDPRRPDPFHEATADLLSELGTSPSHAFGSRLPFGLDRAARRAELDEAGASDDPLYEEIEWTLRLDPSGVRALYATFSPIASLVDESRERVLDALVSIAETRFGGVVERRLVTPIHVGRRRA